MRKIRSFDSEKRLRSSEKKIMSQLCEICNNEFDWMGLPILCFDRMNQNIYEQIDWIVKIGNLLNLRKYLKCYKNNIVREYFWFDPLGDDEYFALLYEKLSELVSIENVVVNTRNLCNYRVSKALGNEFISS